MSEVQKLKEALRGAFANRAMIYHHVYQAIAERHGEDEAAAIMKDALYARGCEVGRLFADLDPADMQGIKDAFLDFIPNHDLLEPEIRRADDGGVDIKFHRCPLKEAWVDAGLTAAQVARLCEVAGVIDNGTFEGAGFNFTGDTWKPGEEGCCFLHIRPGPTDELGDQVTKPNMAGSHMNRLGK